MNQDKKHDIALMRYSAIAPLVTGQEGDFPSLSAYFRDASARGVKAPDGSTRHYADSTIERWYLDYKHKGFDGLLPVSRSDAGHPRKLDDELVGKIRHMKESFPRLSAAAIHRQLLSDGSIRKPSLHNEWRH